MKKIATILIALVAIIVIGLAIAIMTIDVNTYKPQIIEVLNKQTGRTVKLDGPIKLGFSSMGMSLSVENASISNPSWASRPQMAGIGKFQLGVALMPLLDKQLVITGIKIENADIQLESAAGSKNNWDMQPAAATNAPPAKKALATTEKSSDQAVAIKVSNISVKNSQLAMRDVSGKISVFKVTSLTVGTESGGIGIHGDAEYNGAPIKVNVKAQASDFMTARKWPFDADLSYANFELKAKGKADLDAKKATIDSYSLSSGKSDIHGQLAASWGGVRPSISGTLLSDKFDPNDFKPANAVTDGKMAASETKSNSQRVFSDAPLPFDALKSVDASVDVTIAEIVLKNTSLKQVAGKLSMANGVLSLPVKTTFGSSAISMNVGANGAASPAQVSFTFTAPGVDIADLLKAMNSPAFMTGTGDADISLTASGNSMHALASSANGKINVIAGAGDISPKAAGDLSASFAQFLTGGKNSNIGMNCMAARFVATNGVVKDNGVLLDTTAATILGQGGFNLGAENINLLLTPKAKAGTVSSILPPLRVNGTFFQPGFMIDPSAIVQNVAGILAGGSLNGNVPDIQTQAGQNSCVYTLDHPKASSAAGNNVLKNLGGNSQQKINDVGNKLMKGLFGK